MSFSCRLNSSNAAKNISALLVSSQSILPDFRSERLRQRDWAESKTDLTLAERRAFLRKPLAQRQLILATQAQQMVEHYQTSTEWRELMAGDIIDD